MKSILLNIMEIQLNIHIYRKETYVGKFPCFWGNNKSLSVTFFLVHQYPRYSSYF